MSAATFLDDIRSQPETLASLCREYVRGDLAQALRRAAAAIRAPRMPICLTGMGASYFALVAAKAMLDRAGVQAVLEDTAYLLEYGRGSIREGQPVILVSQSGRTGEAVGLQEALGDHRPLIVVTNDPRTELAKRAEFVLPLLAIPDGGVALKTYTASVALLLMLAAEICGQPAVDVAAALLARDPIGKAIALSERHLDTMIAFSEGNGYTTLPWAGPLHRERAWWCPSSQGDRETSCGGGQRRAVPSRCH